MGTNDINTKDEFRVQWFYDGAHVGESPLVWQKRETAERHAEEYLQVIRTDFGVQLPLLQYRIQARLYNVSRQGWQ